MKLLAKESVSFHSKSEEQKFLNILKKSKTLIKFEGKNVYGVKKSVMTVEKKQPTEGYELRGSSSLVNKHVNNSVFRAFKVTPLKK